MLNFYLGRQPIFTPDLDVIAYEILFRGNADALDSGEMSLDGDQATSEVILNSFIEVGLEKLVGSHQAFINLTRNFLVNDMLLPPASEQLVLEVLEDVKVDDELIDAVKKLKEKGYIIALDDFIYHEEFEPLLKLADIVKIDLRALEKPEVAEYVRRLRAYPLKLLAEKVEDLDEFEWCKLIGFDYFQGYFLCRPKLVAGRRIPASRLNTLRMLARLQDPEVNVKSLSDIIGEDVALSFKLLKYINSAAFEVGGKINSIKHAIVYLGLDEVRHWASMVAVSGVDDNPHELMVIALVRGKMCELLAGGHPEEVDKGMAFIVGMFSVLDAIMGATMEEVLESLPLSDHVTDALLRDRGRYSEILHAAKAHEEGDWSGGEREIFKDISVSDYYVAALEWAGVTSGVLRSPA